MFTKGIIATTLLFVLCIKFGQGLQCFEHGFCLGDGCRDSVNRTKVCSSGQDKCWKLSTPIGVARGCSSGRCDVQVDSFLGTANVCCSRDLCNSARQIPLITIVTFAMCFIALINRF